MESGKILPEQHQKRKQGGQTLIEFILLLLVVASISFAFLSLANTNLGRFWVAYVRMIVDDPGQNSVIDLN